MELGAYQSQVGTRMILPRCLNIAISLVSLENLWSVALARGIATVQMVKIRRLYSTFKTGHKTG